MPNQLRLLAEQINDEWLILDMKEDRTPEEQFLYETYGIYSEDLELDAKILDDIRQGKHDN